MSIMINPLAAKRTLAQDREALDRLVSLCKSDIQKTRTEEGARLVVNDYHIWAQKHLMALELPVEWLLKKVQNDLTLHTKSMPVASGVGAPEELIGPIG